MKRLIAFIFLALLSLSAYSDDKTTTPILASGCGINNNLIEPFSSCLSKKDLNLTNICRLFPTACEKYLPLKEFTIENIIQHSDNLASEDKIVELKENEHKYSAVSRAFFDFGRGTLLIMVCFLINFIGKHTIVTQDQFDMTVDNAVRDLIIVGFCIIILYPAFSGYTLLQLFFLFIAVKGLSLGTIIYSTYLSFTQTADSVTNLTDIDEYIKSEQSLKRNENYYLAQVDLKKLMVMNILQINSENKIKYAHKNAKTQITINTTQVSMLNRNFSVGSSFKLTSDVDTVNSIGKMETNFVNLNNLDPKVKKYAMDITYTNILEKAISELSVDDTKSVKDGWSEVERRLLGELGKVDTDQKKQIIKVFLNHYFQTMSAALISINKIDGREYRKSFDLINKNARSIAIDTIAADCIRNPNVGYTNILLERKKERQLCGAWDETGSVYSTLILKDAVTYEALITNGNATISTTLEMIVRAKLQIEKARYEAGIPYVSFDAWADYRAKGIAYFPEAVKYSSRNAVIQDIANLRHSLKITPDIDEHFNGTGNSEFEEIQAKLGDTSDLKNTIDAMFEKSAPLVKYSDYMEPDDIETQLNNKVQNANDDGALFDLRSPDTMLRNSLGIKDSAKLTSEGMYSCFDIDKSVCPAPQNDFMFGVSNFSQSVFNQYAQLFTIALVSSMVADGYSVAKDYEFSKDMKKKKYEDSKAAENGGNVSFDKNKEKGLSDKKSKTDKKKRTSGAKEKSWGLFSDLLMKISSTVLFLAATTQLVTDYLPFAFHTTIQISFQIMLAFYVLAGPVIVWALLAKGHMQTIIKFLSYSTILLLFTQPVATFTFLLADSLLNLTVTIFYLFLMNVDIMITAITGSGSWIGTVVVYLIIFIAFLAFPPAIILWVFRNCYSIFYKKTMQMLGVVALDTQGAIDIAKRFRSGTYLVVYNVTKAFKEGAYRKRGARASTLTKEDKRLLKKAERKEKVESNDSETAVEDLKVSETHENGQPKSKRLIKKELEEARVKREAEKALDEEVAKESEKFLNEKRGIKSDKPDEDK